MLLTSVATVVLAVLWIIHLITVQALNTDSWVSLAIGSLGMIQNAIAAGAKRSPAALGFHLRRAREHTIYNKKSFKALKEAEAVEPYVGLSLLPIFFPGDLRPDEIAWRDGRKAYLASLSTADKAGNSQQMTALVEQPLPSNKQINPSDEQITPSDEQATPNIEQAIHSGDMAPPPGECTVSPEKHASVSNASRKHDHAPGFPWLWRR